MTGLRRAVGPPALDLEATAERLQRGIASATVSLGRRGAVVAVSGGIDSSVVAALCARALGPDHTTLLRLPERGLGEYSSDLALRLAHQLGTATHEQCISPALDALGCYAQQDQALRQVFSEYEPGWPYKLVRSRPTGALTVFSLVLERPNGTQESRRVPAEAYRLLLSATNAKQRLRTLISYTWADRLHAAVVGTPNLLELDQGFFVKGGDGLADLKPIAGLYKQQVYALGRYLGLPAAITDRSPTTETFTLAQSQDEFYFGYPLEQMDLLLWGEKQGIAPRDLALGSDLTVAQVVAGYAEVARRRVATDYLHRAPVLLEDMTA